MTATLDWGPPGEYGRGGIPKYRFSFKRSCRSNKVLAKLKIFEVYPIARHSELYKLSLQVGGKALGAAHKNVFVVEAADICCSEVAPFFRTQQHGPQVDLLPSQVLEFPILDGIAAAVNAVIERCPIRAVLSMRHMARPTQKRRDTDTCIDL